MPVIAPSFTDPFGVGQLDRPEDLDKIYVVDEEPKFGLAVSAVRSRTQRQPLHTPKMTDAACSVALRSALFPPTADGPVRASQAAHHRDDVGVDARTDRPELSPSRLTRPN